MKYKIGIVLSGGGIRGIAHLGVLKALEEFGIKPSVISGTSAGAIAGAFYAHGYAIDEIVSIIKNGHFFNVSRTIRKKQGIFSMKGFEKIYHDYFPSNSFSDLKIPLYIAATDILAGEITYFSEGDLSQSIMASSCIPMIFEAVHYQGRSYIDGGVLDNFPIDPLLNNCEKIIGISVNSVQKDIQELHLNTIVDRTVHLLLRNTLQDKIQHCDLFIEPPNMSQFHMFGLRKIDAIFDYGYQYGLSLEKEIKQLIAE
ncbi:hypothetical protein FFWV33_12450 [Flavobacterium faecale]|uniref:PNPLA domain-containing protein n=1 Tax=Flavobacterium faecale TaxID=1355330 RepID=A0A2S1LF37_9FLAO|nr:patatin-like phospholipase family protein [Flavobacterium faecale]AWG22271.1 hypothetical protein FFWV33_12450 [Flavobacterium faecale]